MVPIGTKIDTEAMGSAACFIPLAQCTAGEIRFQDREIEPRTPGR